MARYDLETRKVFGCLGAMVVSASVALGAALTWLLLKFVL
jgi:hypothetical protein